MKKFKFKLQWWCFEGHWHKTTWINVLTLKHIGSEIKLDCK